MPTTPAPTIIPGRRVACAGPTLVLDAQSLEEAIALTERFVQLHVADGWELDCEVRQVYEADFG